MTDDDNNKDNERRLPPRAASASTPGAGDAEGADLMPGAALRWPPCQCGNPQRCPDYVPEGR
ncbi:hypothetical protein QR77_22805 [Streptomyces sp. 150FB]|uniref:hypothetical protein n=1 Tax=Streptomyces sp. 150FB TaxID=1576605 RepID=UPI0005893C53|nr:hypothetical protein [Streptomyces sp. 150FB]KIF75947.1 hypothetical protein QR77_22805 [Streptomyces sp. 150FB]